MQEVIHFDGQSIIGALDVAIEGFHDSHRHLRSAVVENSVEVSQQHLRQLLEWLQALPSERVDPALQVVHYRPFVSVGPQPVQALLEDVRLEHLPVESEVPGV